MGEYIDYRQVWPEKLIVKPAEVKPIYSGDQKIAISQKSNGQLVEGVYLYLKVYPAHKSGNGKISLIAAHVRERTPTDPDFGKKPLIKVNGEESLYTTDIQGKPIWYVEQALNSWMEMQNCITNTDTLADNVKNAGADRLKQLIEEAGNHVVKKQIRDPQLGGQYADVYELPQSHNLQSPFSRLPNWSSTRNEGI